MKNLQIRYNKLLNSQKCMFKLFNKTFFILKEFVESSQKLAENFADLQVENADFVQSNEENCFLGISSISMTRRWTGETGLKVLDLSAQKSSLQFHSDLD